MGPSASRTLDHRESTALRAQPAPCSIAEAAGLGVGTLYRQLPDTRKTDGRRSIADRIALTRPMAADGDEPAASSALRTPSPAADRAPRRADAAAARRPGQSTTKPSRCGQRSAPRWTASSQRGRRWMSSSRGRHPADIVPMGARLAQRSRPGSRDPAAEAESTSRACVRADGLRYREGAVSAPSSAPRSGVLAESTALSQRSTNTPSAVERIGAFVEQLAKL